MLLAGESGLEGFGCALMASAGVVENDGQFAQDLLCLVFGKRSFSNFKPTTPQVDPASGSHALVFAIFDKSRLVAEFGIREALFSDGMEIISPLDIFMDLDATLTDGDIGWMPIDPSSAIVIVDTVLSLMHGGVGVAAENAGCWEMTGMG